VSGRTPTLADADAVATLLNRIADADGTGWVEPGDVRGWLTMPATRPENFRLLEQDGEPVAYADLYVAPAARDRSWADVRVLPERRGAGLEDEALAWAEARSRELGAVLLRAQALPDGSLAAALAGRGYRTIRHSFEMEISLEAEPPEPHWPEGIHVRALAAGEEALAHAPTEEAFADHWEFSPSSLDDWLHNATREGHDPSLWFLALAGDEVAGVCLCRVRAHAGGRIGWCNTLGVLRPWRRRGLGLALLRHAFRELRSRGLTLAGLGVDGENPTGAVRLYERAGMRVASRTDTWELLLG
jgi:mycothiol synthase